MLAAIAGARRSLDDLVSGKVHDLADLSARQTRSSRSTTMHLSLAFIAPTLVLAIVENRLPHGIGLTRLTDLPSDWSDQFAALGLRSPG